MALSLAVEGKWRVEGGRVDVGHFSGTFFFRPDESHSDKIAK